LSRSSASNDIRISQFHIQTIGEIPISTAPNSAEMVPAVPKITTKTPARTGAAIKNQRVARVNISATRCTTAVSDSHVRNEVIVRM
jgi:hypothetical protein